MNFWVFRMTHINILYSSKRYDSDIICRKVACSHANASTTITELNIDEKSITIVSVHGTRRQELAAASSCAPSMLAVPG